MKVPSCKCFEEAIAQQTGKPVSEVMLELKKDVTPSFCNVWVHFRTVNKIHLEGIRMDMNIFPKCGKEFVEV